jgi:hypothetical protein
MDSELHSRHYGVMESRRKPGPKPKGDRSQITLRVPTKHRELYAMAAETAGLALSDYLAMVLAKAHHLPVPDDARSGGEARQESVPAQEGLPLTRVS